MSENDARATQASGAPGVAGPASAGLGRVAYLTGEYPRATDTFVQREVSGLRELGVDVVTCSIRRTDAAHHVGPEQQREHASTFHVIENARRPWRLLRDHAACLLASPGRYLAGLRLALTMRPPGLRGLLYQIFYFAEAGVLARHLERQGVSHLHNHFGNSSCSVAVLASALSGVPYSYTMHGPAIFFEPMRWRIDEKIARARFVSCISHFCRSQGMLFAKPEHWQRLHIVHCGVLPESYSPVRHRPGRKQLLFVGRLEAIKGLPLLLEAAARLRERHPELRVALVGDGGDRRWLERRASELGLSDVVEFTGYLSQAEVAQRLAESDVFVLPSFAEGVPVVLMEAMCSAVPVVATRVAGVGELVEDGVSGFTVPPGDVASLAGRIDALLADTELRQRMGDAGRAKVMAEFDVRKETRWLHTILQHYATGRGGGLPLRPEGESD